MTTRQNFTSIHSGCAAVCSIAEPEELHFHGRVRNATIFLRAKCVCKITIKILFMTPRHMYMDDDDDDGVMR